MNTAATRLKRRQRNWLHGGVIARCMDGQDLDQADVDALPPAPRREVKAIAERCAVLHASGQQGAAQMLACEAIGGVDLGSWEPPPERPDPAILNEIRR